MTEEDIQVRTRPHRDLLEQIRPTSLGPIATYEAALSQVSLVEDHCMVFREDMIGEGVAVGRVRERKAARELLENSVDDLCREIWKTVTWVLDHREGLRSTMILAPRLR